MVYKKYIKKGGKTFGPYYYESYRENGKVKTRFISGPKNKKNKTINNKLSHGRSRVNLKYLFFSVCILIFLFVILIILKSDNYSISTFSIKDLSKDYLSFIDIIIKLKDKLFFSDNNKITFEKDFGKYSDEDLSKELGEKEIELIKAEHLDKNKNFCRF